MYYLVPVFFFSVLHIMINITRNTFYRIIKISITYLTTTSESDLFELSCMVKTAWDREDLS